MVLRRLLLRRRQRRSLSPSEAPATFYAVVGGNDLYWRVEAPAKAIGAKLCILPESDAAAILQNTGQEAFRWELGEGDTPAVYPDHEGTAVWTRPDPLRAAHLVAMREAGILTVSEVDDNYISNAKLNIFTRTNKWNSTHHRFHLGSMASADRIVFSTEWLRDRYWKPMKQTWRKDELPETFVCRNNVDEADWPEPIPHDGPLRVAWMGSPMHVWDVDIAWAALLHATRNLGCEAWLVGYNPADPDPPPTIEKGFEKVRQWRKVGAKHIPWQKPADYHRMAIPADIGLCPLLRNDHTLGKSDVKFIEYTMSGAAVIASNNEVYNRTIVHGETGLLVGSAEEMLQAVERLVRDHKLRETLLNNAQQYVREERGLKQLREEWGVAIT